MRDDAVDGAFESTDLFRLYLELREMPAAERARRVQALCEGQPELRTELLALLEDGEAAEAFFERLGRSVQSAAPGETERSPARGVGRDPVEDHASLTPSPPDVPPGSTVGRYRIVELIGSGGMGAVYRAFDPTLEREVALKLLPFHRAADPEASERLLAEARAAAALEHPNICAVHEAGEAEGWGTYIAMPLYEGETLKERIARGPLDIGEAAAIASEVAAALAAAHARGIVHRDVKPGNVMLAPDGSVTLLDFGLAKGAGADLTRPGFTPGTVAYMAPEQVRGAPVDPRADLWALGVLLYEMLAGTRPFRGDREEAVLYSILHEEPMPLRRHRPELPPAVEHLLHGLLQKEPRARTGGAGEVAHALEAIARGDVDALRTAAITGRTSSRELRRPLGTPARGWLIGFLAVGLVAGADLLRAGDRAPEGLGEARLAQAFFERGLEYLNRPGDADIRKFPPAVRFFRQALEVDPSFAPAHVGLAEAYRRNKLLPMPAQRDSGLLYGRRAVELAPGLAEAHATLGQAMLLSGEWDGAEASLRTALRLDPGAADALSGLARLSALRGRLDEAARWERRAARADRASAARWSLLGGYLFDLGDLDGADSAFRRAAELAPDFPEPPYLLAQIARIRGEPERGDAWMEGLLGPASDHPATRMLLGRYEAQRGRFGPAEEHFARSPPTVAGSHWRAFLLREIGEGERADSLVHGVLAALAAMEREGIPFPPRARLYDAGYRGDVDGALAVLREGWRSGLRGPAPDPPEIGVYWLDHEPFLRDIRDDPRFRALLGEMRAGLDSMRALAAAEQDG